MRKQRPEIPERKSLVEMAWRRRIISHDRFSSRGEQLILEALHQDHIHPLTKSDIILETTRPDFLFPDQKLAVYLDGPPHIKNPAKEELDAKITEKLQRQGYKVLRIQYRPPLGKAKALAIASEISAQMRGRP